MYALETQQHLLPSVCNNDGPVSRNVLRPALEGPDRTPLYRPLSCDCDLLGYHPHNALVERRVTAGQPSVRIQVGEGRFQSRLGQRYPGPFPLLSRLQAERDITSERDILRKTKLVPSMGIAYSFSHRHRALVLLLHRVDSCRLRQHGNSNDANGDVRLCCMGSTRLDGPIQLRFL